MNTVWRILRRGTLVLALLWIAWTSLGCNTIHGVGQDVQNVGESIQKHTD